MKKLLLFFILMFSMPVFSATVDDGNKALKKKDYRVAKNIYYDLAVAGNSEAQFLLGRMYVDKLLGADKVSEGVKWLKIAVKNRHQWAADMLSRMYMSGMGVKFSPEKGAEYLILASEFRDPFELDPECE